MLKMKKVMFAAVVGACLAATTGLVSTVSAQTTSTPTATPGAQAPAKSVAQTANPSKAAPKKKVTHPVKRRETTRRRNTRSPRKDILLGPVTPTIPAGAAKWSCDENLSMFIAGDMRRDAILTVYWQGRDYKLPREATTTGADRFYDASSGMDLVVIPTKAMLFMDKGDRTRLADECKTLEMVQQNAPAPTQSNALKRGQ